MSITHLFALHTLLLKTSTQVINQIMQCLQKNGLYDVAFEDGTRMVRVLCALTAHKPAHAHGHGHDWEVETNDFFARTKAQQGRLLSFWVGCLCPTRYGGAGSL
jgi:hypothetical protein